MSNFPYYKKMKVLSKKLRKESTLSEVLLWEHLKKRQLCGCNFNRQKPLLNYIVDFYCKEKSLVIEIDGASHENKYEKDLAREKELKALGLHIIRFKDEDVKRNMEEVLRSIETWILNSKK